MTTKFDRRTFIQSTGASALATALLPSAVSAQHTGTFAITKAFLDSLQPWQQKVAKFPFAGDVHKAWEFRGTYVKPGLLIEAMSPHQKQLTADLLNSVLSPSGYAKTRLIMEMQDVMRALGSGPSDRSSEKFAIAVFGAPSLQKLWGLRIEGHHLSLSWTLKGEQLVAVTPASFSVIPQNVPVGSRRGTVVLDKEEGLGRRLIQDLSGKKRERAIIQDAPIGEVLTLAGKESSLKDKHGLAVADMKSAQRDLIWELIEATTVDPWPHDIASNQRDRILQGDREAVHFSWSGGTRQGELYYYRIHGDTFTLELTTALKNPEHLHAV